MSNNFSLSKLARLFKVGSAGKFITIDGSGNPIVSDPIPPGGVSTSFIADGAVTLVKIDPITVDDITSPAHNITLNNTFGGY